MIDKTGIILSRNLKYIPQLQSLDLRSKFIYIIYVGTNELTSYMILELYDNIQLIKQLNSINLCIYLKYILYK